MSAVGCKAVRRLMLPAKLTAEPRDGGVVNRDNIKRIKVFTHSS